MKTLYSELEEEEPNHTAATKLLKEGPTVEPDQGKGVEPSTKEATKGDELERDLA